jgi:RNase H-fold protein (predicted Holliday junction resolvase)
MKEQENHSSSKSNSTTTCLSTCIEEKISNTKFQTIVKMINELKDKTLISGLKENVNKQMNELKWNTNEQMNEIKKTIQDMEEEINKDMESLKNN